MDLDVRAENSKETTLLERDFVKSFAGLVFETIKHLK